MTAFNKWYPDRPVEAPKATLLERRAFALRWASLLSTAMLVAGYLLMVLWWNA